MSRIDDLIIQAEVILKDPGRATFDPSLLLEMLVEIAKNTRHNYDATRPSRYETPTEAYDRGSADQAEEFRRERARRAGRETQATPESNESLS